MAKSYLVCHSKQFLKEHFLIPMQNNLLEEDVEGEAETYIKPHSDNFMMLV